MGRQEQTYGSSEKKMSCYCSGIYFFIHYNIWGKIQQWGGEKDGSFTKWFRDLPSPVHKGKLSLEDTLKKRESVRSFSSKPLTKEELSQLLWAIQGTTRSWGARTAPSAGALFPLEIYVVLKEGVFRYSVKGHHLVRIMEQDLRNTLSKAALGQDCIVEAPAVFVIAAVYERTSRKYGNRAERYVKMEAGHAGQNLLLQAVSLGLGAVPVGAFQDEQVQQALHLPVNHEPLYLIPVGSFGHISK
jgi:SagB-type dehydrogenase family enzyme